MLGPSSLYVIMQFTFMYIDNRIFALPILLIPHRVSTSNLNSFLPETEHPEISQSCASIKDNTI